MQLLTLQWQERVDYRHTPKRQTIVVFPTKTILLPFFPIFPSGKARCRYPARQFSGMGGERGCTRVRSYPSSSSPSSSLCTARTVAHAVMCRRSKNAGRCLGEKQLVIYCARWM